jgi:hypothetical protein
MSHLPIWEQRGQTYAEYVAEQETVLERATELARIGLTPHEAVVVAEMESGR